MKNKKKVMASTNNGILGTFEGEVLDANITNNNGLDITKEVMTNVLNSEEYRDGIKYGWFIGFLGHPVDPNCMDFKDACIVMTEMTVEDNGKVYGKFNLIDTPVGRTVKAFIDAGVTFGISIRGAGDIIGNSVDPETFVFRGFDLVSFPAYPESIPEYTAVAATTNLEDRKKYQAICAAVRENLPAITSNSTIEVLKSQFANKSEEYRMLEKHAKNINSSVTFNIDKQKVEAVTDLYLQSQEELAKCNNLLEREKHNTVTIKASYNRKISSMKRIMNSQLSDISNKLDSITASRDALRRKAAVLASQNRDLNADISTLNTQLSSAKKSNLIYKQRVEANTQTSESKDTIIANLKKELSETVTTNSKVQSAASNLDEENKNLKKKLAACEKLLNSFQNAYADVYASALGVRIDSLSITPSTSVEDIEHVIAEATNSSNIPSTPMADDTYLDMYDETDNELVTL